MRTNVMRTLALGGVVALGASGCATKKYVAREVGEVNQKADNLSSEMEKTQQRVSQNETRISEVDREAQAGKQSAQEALNRAADAEKAAKGKLIYQVTLTDDQVKFPFGKAEMKDEAKGSIEPGHRGPQEREQGRLRRDRGTHRLRRLRGVQQDAGRAAGHGGPRLPARAARDRAEPPGGHLLRRDPAGERQQEPRQPGRNRRVVIKVLE